ncbi:MAG: hypothetical protein ACBR12_26865 [Microcoleus sp.]
MSQQPGGQQVGWINWALIIAIISMLLAFTGPIPSFWENVYKQAMVIKDNIFQSSPGKKGEIIIRRQVPIEKIP